MFGYLCGKINHQNNVHCLVLFELPLFDLDVEGLVLSMETSFQVKTVTLQKTIDSLVSGFLSVKSGIS